MSFLTKYFLCCFVLLFSSVVFAQVENKEDTEQINQDGSSQQNEPLKIGYFNFAQVMSNIPQAKEAESRLGDEFANRKANIEGLDEELKKMAEELNRDAVVLTAAEQEAKRRELRNRRREFQLLLEEYQEDLSLRQNQETEALRKLVRKAVLDIGKEGKYDLIIEQGVVLFASEKVNITAQVLQRLQQQN